jgi:toxin ParE1/3/4
MKRYGVDYLPHALEDMTSIFLYVLDISQNSTTAERYVDRIYARCEKIGDAPFGGVPREDLGAGIRMVAFERRAVILYRVEDEIVLITNVFSGGRDYEALLRKPR